MSDDNPTNDSVSDNKPHFELYIKASVRDGESKGSCPICQQWFMVAHLLAEKSDVHFQVYTVPANNLPESFKAKTMSKTFPIVIGVQGRDTKGQDISNCVFDDADEVEKFFESVNVSQPLLKRTEAKNQLALRHVEDLYKKFNLFLQNPNDNGTKLTQQLKSIDGYLGEMETVFLCGSTISYSDTVLLSRLQHIRVAGKAYRGYEIPKELKSLWQYLSTAYQTKAFIQTLPSDQDIKLHYETKATTKLEKTIKLEGTSYTTDVDPECLNGEVEQQNGDD